MTSLLNEAEITDAREALTPAMRKIIHDFARIISADLESANQPAAAYVELAAWLIAEVIRKGRVVSIPAHILEQMKEFVQLRADELVKGQ